MRARLAFNSRLKPMRKLPTRALIKVPRQRRSIEMVHSILDHAVVVLQREGAAHLSTNQVAAEAGISVGSLYQYFANKQMLLQGLLERGMLESEELIRTTAAADPTAPVEDVLRHVLETMFEAVEPARETLADLVSGLGLGPGASGLALLETRIGDLVRNYLLRHSDRYQLVGGPAALYFGTNAIIYVFLKWLTERERTIDRDELIDAMIAFVTSAVRPV